MRYFIEVSYKGTRYAGFQAQPNANTIQAEVERALFVFLRTSPKLTGSSRTDAGVHALQNYFHFDYPDVIAAKAIYNLNALLPQDISVVSIRAVAPDCHARFDAVSRMYTYRLYSAKNAFLCDRAWYNPYKIDINLLQQAAQIVLSQTDFTSFAKRNAQVNAFNCTIFKSEWYTEADCLVYKVEANRFLRGMVRGLVGTMLQAGRGIKTIADFEQVFAAKQSSKADFSTPAHGLFLHSVKYPDGYFDDE